MANLEQDKQKARKHAPAGLPQTRQRGSVPQFDLQHTEQNDAPPAASSLSRFGGLVSPDVGNGHGAPIGT